MERDRILPARIIHEHFCCNRRSVATTSLRPAGCAPPLRDWLPTDHLACFVVDVLEELDLQPVLHTYSDLTRGTVPYGPRMLVAVLLYAYAVGEPAPRQIARKLHEDIAFRVLAASTTTDFRTISDFRKQHLVALRRLFVQVLRLCQHAGLVTLGHIDLDGTKLTANASTHKAMSYDRMGKEEGLLHSALGYCSSEEFEHAASLATPATGATMRFFRPRAASSARD